MYIHIHVYIYIYTSNTSMDASWIYSGACSGGVDLWTESGCLLKGVDLDFPVEVLRRYVIISEVSMPESYHFHFNALPHR